MNVCLNGNLAQIPVIYIDVLLTRRERLHCLWPQRCFALYQILQYIVLQGCIQIPLLRQTVSLLRENMLHIFICYMFAYTRYMI